MGDPQATTSSQTARPGRPFAWLFDVPAHSERTLRMESLIARLRVLVIAVNSLALALLLNTRGYHVDAAWTITGLSWMYALPVAILQPYKRWRVFQTSFITAIADSLAVAAMVAATGGERSPFFLLYFLSVAAVAMRFDLRQALFCCLFYACTYAVVFVATSANSADAMGVLTLRLAYLFFVALGVGNLAREEEDRSRQIEVIERLHAENTKLMSRTERAARTDKLTGLMNRAHFEKEAHRELRKTRAGGAYVSVLFCDMDNLKRINDELGHDIGDRVLKQVGTTLRRCLRPSEFIGRYGGDEFVVVLPNLTRETAYERAEQLIEAIRGINDGLPEDLHIGLSVGVATCPFDAREYGMLVKLADQAMYLAKRDGGNRVRTANDLRLFWEEIPHTAA
ncbi:MAG: GGDEF domain-containing protein [Chloroflexota bacterium]|nr:GGDEF domain-containing protein [Chloroflexota bacterium]